MFEEPVQMQLYHVNTRERNDQKSCDLCSSVQYIIAKEY